jgi:hypothetical protein
LSQCRGHSGSDPKVYDQAIATSGQAGDGAGGRPGDPDLEPFLKVVQSDDSFVIPWLVPDSSTGTEMWKPEHRRAAVRHGLRYQSDLTDAERALVDRFH